MKVSELEGSELDYWVAKAIGWEHYDGYDGKPLCDPARAGGWVSFRSSDLWSNGGPLIEEWEIWLSTEPHDGAKVWVASAPPHMDIEEKVMEGSTPLIAACRAIVASVYGEEVPTE